MVAFSQCPSAEGWWRFLTSICMEKMMAFSLSIFRRMVAFTLPSVEGWWRFLSLQLLNDDGVFSVWSEEIMAFNLSICRRMVAFSHFDQKKLRGLLCPYVEGLGTFSRFDLENWWRFTLSICKRVVDVFSVRSREMMAFTLTICKIVVDVFSVRSGEMMGFTLSIFKRMGRGRPLPFCTQEPSKVI